MNETKPCDICSNTINNVIHSAPERAFRMGGEFFYQECTACGYLELLNVPENLGDYYPPNYYSFKKQSGLKDWLKAERGRYFTGTKTPLGFFLSRIFGEPPVCGWIRPLAVKPGAKFLDVGCGSGIALRDLKYSHFSKVAGIDPFLDNDLQFGRVKIQKKSIDEVDEKFDVILLNHSYEHMPQQRHVLNQLAKIVAPNGSVLIRMPIIGYSWKTYQTLWYGIDTPRHLFVHSIKSFKLLIEKTGVFEIASTVFDSHHLHILCSEQNQKGISLNDANSYAVDEKKSIFTKAEISAAKALTKELNQREESDQALFYLKLKPNVRSLT